MMGYFLMIWIFSLSEQAVSLWNGFVQQLLVNLLCSGGFAMELDSCNNFWLLVSSGGFAME